jgi:NAD(P)-dependent dehydrogenase (short-subunit alcohol dehydrogenase family)
MKLSGRTAFVSGAGGPMGTAIARRLAGAGADLLVTDISGNRLTAAADALRRDFPDRRIVSHRANGLIETEANETAQIAIDQLGRIDILVNVVGGIKSADLAMPVLAMTEERWDTTFAFNLKGIFYLVRALGPQMVRNQSGRIINISSVTFAGDDKQPEYGAAKAAVASLSRSLSMELAPFVTVNCIAPGMIQTSVLDRADPALVEAYRNRTVLKRLGTPEDIAGAALFLASDDAAYITGVILPVSGGIWPAL